MLTKILLGALAVAVVVAAIMFGLWQMEAADHEATKRAAAEDAARANDRWAATLERRLSDQADAQARTHAAELIRAKRRATVAERIANAPSASLAACPAIGTALGVLRERGPEDRRPDARAAGRAADVFGRARGAGS